MAELQPCELLPGRSICEDWANGRKNFEMTERAEMTQRSTLLCYELIGYEPTPPAVVLQFDDIRRVFAQEKPLLDKARGLMGNARQPIMTLPNLFFFARAAQDGEYLNKSDAEVLHALAQFLGGEAEVLIPAWECLRRDASTLPADLSQRLRASKLESQDAQNIPGGPARCLEILAEFTQARLKTLRALALPVGEDAIVRGVSALVAWWKITRYVFLGEPGEGFRLDFVHPQLRGPVEAILRDSSDFKVAALKRLIASGVLSREEASTN